MVIYTYKGKSCYDQTMISSTKRHLYCSACLIFMSQTLIRHQILTASASMKPHHYSKHEEKMLAVTNLTTKSNIIAYDLKLLIAKEAYVKATYY